MTDIVKAIAMACGVLLLTSLAYVFMLLGLTYISDGNRDLLRNSTERIPMQTTTT